MKPSFVETLPIRFGSKAEFEHVVSSLRQACFDEQTIQRILNIKTMSDVGSVKATDVDFTGVSAELQLFIRLFLFQRFVSRAEAEDLLGSSTLDAFLALGLLGIGEFGANQLYAQVLL